MTSPSPLGGEGEVRGKVIVDQQVVLDQLMSLKIETDVWQAHCRQLPTLCEEGSQPVRPWIILVGSRITDLALGQELLPAQPPPTLLWQTLAQAIQSPLAGEPPRPTELHVLPRK